jgi:hypothetical protein
MTTTDDRPAVTIEHPDWCYDHMCTVELNDENAYVSGDHLRYLNGFHTIWGSKIALYLTTEGASVRNARKTGRPAKLRVALIVLAHEDDVPEDLRDTVAEDDWRRDHGERVELEPEEARMLGRFLIEAADERDRLAR